MLPFKAVNRAIETILLREGSYCCNNSISERPYESWRVDMTSVEKNVLVKFLGVINTVMTTTQSETCIVDKT